MLNNNFSKLIKLYEKYQRQQRNKTLFRLFGLLLLLAAIYLIYLQFSQKTSLSTPDTSAKSSLQSQTTNNTATNATSTIKDTSISNPHKNTNAIQNTKHTQNTTSQNKEPFQLQATQRESLYRMLVDYKDKKSYTTAIKIAQFYLVQKEYKKAVKWAVEASKKDPSQAQSWIIYAKAKQALGKPDVAKRALAIYLKHNSSKEAQELLNAL